MTEYEWLRVWNNRGGGGDPECFEKCQSIVTVHRVLIVIANGRHHTWNAEYWTKVEGLPLVNV